MPEVAITSVKENIARYENVIMKQSYSEAGADSFTTAQVIDEETGNVICEAGSGGGGGGGDSDFNTATLTLVFPESTILDNAAITAVFCIVSDELAEGQVFFSTDGESVNIENIVLYKSKSAPIPDGSLTYSLSIVEGEGDNITYDEENGNYYISGNAKLLYTPRTIDIRRRAENSIIK